MMIRIRNKIRWLLAAIFFTGFISSSFAVWSSKEAYEKHRESMRQLHSKGIKPPPDSPYLGTWGEKDSGWIYKFTSDGVVTITKKLGDISKGTWVHEIKGEEKLPNAVYRVSDYATTMWLRKGKLVIFFGDTWAELPRIKEVAD